MTMVAVATPQGFFIISLHSVSDYLRKRTACSVMQRMTSSLPHSAVRHCAFPTYSHRLEDWQRREETRESAMGAHGQLLSWVGRKNGTAEYR